MPWILTASGKRFDLLDPKPEQVDLNDIATALGRIPRFTGHVGYSVASHCCHVAEIVRKATVGGDDDAYLCGLLHDASEAYTNDISSPMKEAIGGGIVHAIERRIQGVIFEALGLSFEAEEWRDIEEVVKAADQLALRVERSMLLPDHPDWPKACVSSDECLEFELTINNASGNYWKDAVSSCFHYRESVVA